MYGKLVDGKLIFAKHFITTDKETILNPTGEIYEKYGFKKVREDVMPELSEGQIMKVWYEETENEIVKKYGI